MDNMSKDLLDRMKLSATAALGSAESLHKIQNNHKTKKLVEMYYELLNELKSI